ncbi:DUF3667 domain-containing protein [Spirosoma sp. HMF4905]|uniref:DUF3667 domain-containing protein n=1 Tax=Spirosoma arboris TaxID=2682092 RepID=A0A7K1S3W5_9BACT|nr:DUF3667 domain-containing protein [Spirosoma arboris]MVM28521.1 DUF3667 domain-containing protein [Spirosoma arboris]
MTCQTCGHHNQEKFCPNCGEKRFDPHSLTLSHVAEEIVESFTHADHTLLRTLNTLLFKPGYLSVEYVAGRRVRYMKPLGLFLVINLVFFLLVTYNAFNQPLSSFLNYDNYTAFGTKEAVAHKLKESGQTLAAYQIVFDASMKASSKSYLIVLIPVYALIFSLLMWSAHRTFIEHLVFAAHFLSFVLLYFLVQQFLIVLPFIWLFGQEQWAARGDLIWSLLSLILVGLYQAKAFSRFYQVDRRWSVLAALLSTVLFAGVVMAYRLLLFYKIVYLSH